ncbi:GGDEF domain-containing protein [Massilia sp. B-10]|nr:GGDEF domain-containing protein [Massilia sp. B-10]
MADQLQSLPWEGKLACRLGGDEFVVYLPACGERDARELVGQLQHALRQAMYTQSWPVTYSIGVALYPDGPLAAERMFSYTDTLMYQAKQSKRRPRPLWPLSRRCPLAARARGRPPHGWRRLTTPVGIDARRAGRLSSPRQAGTGAPGGARFP